MSLYSSDLFKASFDEISVQDELESLAVLIVKKLDELNLKISFAESCTGGMLAKLITDVPGASAVFECGIVSYSNDMKMKLLKVKKDTIDRYTEISEEAAREMAVGALEVSRADIAVSVTGACGPAGAGDYTSGISFVALAKRDGVICEKLDLREKRLSRSLNRLCTAKLALRLVCDNLH